MSVFCELPTKPSGDSKSSITAGFCTDSLMGDCVEFCCINNYPNVLPGPLAQPNFQSPLQGRWSLCKGFQTVRPTFILCELHCSDASFLVFLRWEAEKGDLASLSASQWHYSGYCWAPAARLHGITYYCVQLPGP